MNESDDLESQFYTTLDLIILDVTVSVYRIQTAEF